uniref:Branched-chain-amino-acid aminotransferase n=1 Tax=Tetraodon nigroviridis TaxID=99883 RepID=H3CN93_TETNG
VCCVAGARVDVCAEPLQRNVLLCVQAADLTIQLSAERLKSAPAAPKSFGTVFTDHMLTIEWTEAEGWGAPRIQPFRNLSVHPACTSLHYSIQLFEGLKAYSGEDKRLRLFRPMLNMKRMSKSAQRVCLPTFDESELLECIRRLVELEQDWAFLSESSSHLYIRPTFISTEATLGLKKPTSALLYVIVCLVGSYFSSTSEGLSLWADPKYTRAAKGGNGDCKLGGNYGGSLAAQAEAQRFGCQQVLWLYGDDQQITEAGTMNVFLYWINEDGVEELATPPLDGIILPGVTRQSILDITRKWGEFAVSERYLTMDQLCSALEQRRVKEMFGSGTACMICHLSHIVYKGEKLSLPSLDGDSLLSTRITKEVEDIQFNNEHISWKLGRS